MTATVTSPTAAAGPYGRRPHTEAASSRAAMVVAAVASTVTPASISSGWCDRHHGTRPTRNEDAGTSAAAVQASRDGLQDANLRRAALAQSGVDRSPAAGEPPRGDADRRHERRLDENGTIAPAWRCAARSRSRSAAAWATRSRRSPVERQGWPIIDEGRTTPLSASTVGATSTSCTKGARLVEALTSSACSKPLPRASPTQVRSLAAAFRYADEQCHQSAAGAAAMTDDASWSTSDVLALSSVTGQRRRKSASPAAAGRWPGSSQSVHENPQQPMRRHHRLR